MQARWQQKVTARHLTRTAFLYIRQSSLHQVVAHTESTRRQYQFRERAVSLGWPEEQIVVIDSDQGQSGASADRAGFQHLVAEVGMGHAGLVMGLEVSRLARNSTDWHRLLEICALTETLILDEDGLYDPQCFNDRLLLGLKGTMSEAELHMLRARLQGGLLNKARRGELKMPLPIGFVYDEESRVVLDPDQQVQETLRLFFKTFRRVGSALGTVKALRKAKVPFPRRKGQGPWHKKALVWADLDFPAALRTLQNPRYAGIYAYGKTRQRRLPNGRYLMQRKPPEEWVVLIPDAHEGYITQQEYEENLRRLAENARAIGADRRRSPAREGPALLQGLALCGRCGRRMTVHYHHRASGLIPSYSCARKEEPSCQIVHGTGVDEAVSQLLLAVVRPVTLETSLAVQRTIEEQFEQAQHLRQQQVERARYEAELARQRFLQVDPNHRLVAANLEAEWNERLKALMAAQEEAERREQEERQTLGEEQRAKILALASDFPRLWNDPRTPVREKKRMVRLLIEDVTLLRNGVITAHVRFKGGATKTLEIALPKPLSELNKTDPEVVAEIDRLLDHHTESEIAQILNERGLRSGTDRRFSPEILYGIRRKYGLKRRYQRLRENGLLTLTELAGSLHVGTQTLKRWVASGRLRAYRYSDERCLYEPPEPQPDEARPSVASRPTATSDNEVQYEA